MWEAFLNLCLILSIALAALFYTAIFVECVTRAIVRGWLDERFTVNRRLYGRLQESDDDGKQA